MGWLMGCWPLMGRGGRANGEGVGKGGGGRVDGCGNGFDEKRAGEWGGGPLASVIASRICHGFGDGAVGVASNGRCAVDREFVNIHIIIIIIPIITGSIIIWAHMGPMSPNVPKWAQWDEWDQWA